MNKTYVYAFFAACLLLFAMWFMQIPNSANVADAYDVEDLVSDDVVLFYEKSIAEENFITGISPFRKQRMCETYSVSEKKLNALLILQDLGARIGEKQNLNDLAKMNDRQLSAYGKKVVITYISTLSDERKMELKQEWKERKT